MKRLAGGTQEERMRQMSTNPSATYLIGRTSVDAALSRTTTSTANLGHKNTQAAPAHTAVLSSRSGLGADRTLTRARTQKQLAAVYVATKKITFLRGVIPGCCNLWLTGWCEEDGRALQRPMAQKIFSNGSAAFLRT